jgi:hypothetical protein
VDHLADDAWRIVALAGPAANSDSSLGKGVGRAPPTPNASEISRALRFTSKGKNAFRDAASELRSYRAATKYYTARSRGMPAAEALETVMDWLGERDEANAKNIIRAGKRLWQGGKTSP